MYMTYMYTYYTFIYPPIFSLWATLTYHIFVQVICRYTIQKLLPISWMWTQRHVAPATTGPSKWIQKWLKLSYSQSACVYTFEEQMCKARGQGDLDGQGLLLGPGPKSWWRFQAKGNRLVQGRQGGEGMPRQIFILNLLYSICKKMDPGNIVSLPPPLPSSGSSPDHDIQFSNHNKNSHCIFSELFPVSL